MSFLTLVRHAQASFFAADYDQLSGLGQEQARRLGKHWVERGFAFDEIYAGPRARQQHTAELVGDCYRQAGLPWPDPVLLADLDEYDFMNILRRLAPELARQDRDFGGLLERFQASAANGDRESSFQRMFEAVMVHWLTAPSVLAEMESWPAFQARVRRALSQICERPASGRRVGVFTSGGVIGTAVQIALAAPDRAALELNWRSRNCSLTEFVFTRGRITLDSFNTVPHLADMTLWTYR